MPTIRAFTLNTDRTGTASRAAAAAVAARRPITRLSEARSRAARSFADDMLSAAAATWEDREAPPGRPAHAAARAEAVRATAAGKRGHAAKSTGTKGGSRVPECATC